MTFASKSVFALISAIACVISAPVAAAEKKPTPPIASTTDGNKVGLGWWVERDLQDMMTACLGTKLQAELKKPFGSGTESRDVTAIPNLVATALKLRRSGLPDPWIIPQSDGDLARLFGIVFTSPAKFDADDRTGESYLAKDYSVVEDIAAAPGFSTVSYLTTCSLGMNAALSAQGDYTIPVARVQASISSGYDGSNAYALNLVDGIFESPIVAMYRRQSANPELQDAGQLYAALVFWDWYAADSNRLNSTNLILDKFSGLTVYKRAGYTQETKFNVSLGGSFQVPGTSLASSTAVKFQRTTDLSLQGFASAAYVDPATQKALRTSFSIPLPKEIAVVAARSAHVTWQADPTSDLTIVDQTSKYFFEQIRYLPNQYCASAYWKTNDSSVTIIGAPTPARDPVTKLPYCTFKMEYKPSGTVSAAPGALNVAFNFVSSSALTSEQIIIPASTVPMDVQKIPEVVGLSSTPEPKIISATPTETSLQWTFTYNLKDNRKVRNSDDIDLGDVKPIKCTLGSEPYALPAYPQLVASIPPGNTMNSKVMNVIATVKYPGVLPANLTGVSYATCTLEGWAYYTMQGISAPVQRGFPSTTIRYPVPTAP